MLGDDSWTLYRFLTQPNSDFRNLPFGPKPVLRIDSNHLFGVEPPRSGWAQHHPELEGDTALSALQRGKISRVLTAAENASSRFSRSCRASHPDTSSRARSNWRQSEPGSGVSGFIRRVTRIFRIWVFPERLRWSACWSFGCRQSWIWRVRMNPATTDSRVVSFLKNPNPSDAYGQLTLRKGISSTERLFVNKIQL